MGGRTAKQVARVEGGSDAVILGQGVDTLVETFKVKVSPVWCETLDRLKQEAADSDAFGKGRRPVCIGGQLFMVYPRGARGFSSWLIQSDKYEFKLSSGIIDWAITVKYFSAALWQYGMPALQAEVDSVVKDLGNLGLKPLPEPVITSFHYCWDVWSSDFTGDMRPGISGQVVAHSRVPKEDFEPARRTYSRGDFVETLTIGTKKSIQLQVYNKTKEIHDVSGKDWLFGHWREAFRAETGAELSDDDLRHVWRLEVRFSAKALKPRQVRSRAALLEHLEALVHEVLTTRRLTIPTADSNRARWPMHWFWSEVLSVEVRIWRPLGRLVTGRRDEIVAQARRAIAGSVRSLMVAALDDFDVSRLSEFWDGITRQLLFDPAHREKVERAKNRYLFIGSPVG